MCNNHDEWQGTCVRLDLVSFKLNPEEKTRVQTMTKDLGNEKVPHESWSYEVISLFLIHKWPARPIRPWFKGGTSRPWRQFIITAKSLKGVCEAEWLDTKLGFLSHYSWPESQQQQLQQLQLQQQQQLQLQQPAAASQAFRGLIVTLKQCSTKPLLLHAAEGAFGCEPKVQFIIYLTTSPPARVEKHHS